jgi:GDP/UDP-N,N'-diacetylbacillosamine 2-epimerase (hydrolysing)
VIPRKVLIITGSRGEYGYIRPIIREVEKKDDIDYDIVATNMLLVPEFGYAINQFMMDDIKVKYQIDMSMSGYTNASMSKSLGIFQQSLTDIVNNDKPDIILLAGDRGEMLVGSIVGAHMNIPVAHIQAGELSGNIDGMTRHAITKFAHLHFASNSDAEERLLKMGEQKFRVFNTGAPQLDEFHSYKYLKKEEFFHEFQLDIVKGFVLVVQHSITEQSSDSEEQMLITLQSVIEVGIPIVLIYPNNDAGSIGIQNALDSMNFVDVHIKRNVNRESYANLMKYAKFMIGNSSSGILEAPSFKLPAINIGRRQIGRLQAKNVVNVEFDKNKIKEAISFVLNDECFLSNLKSVKSPYGDGFSSKRIVEILQEVTIDKDLLNKELTY